MAAMRAKSGEHTSSQTAQAPSTSPSTQRTPPARQCRNKQAAITPGAEDDDDLSSSEDDDYSFHPNNSRRLQLQQKRRRDKKGTARDRRKPYVTESRRAVCQYIDEHYAGRPLDDTVTMTSVCRAIARTYDLKYFDRAKQKLLRRDHEKVMDVMVEIQRRYNGWPLRSGTRALRDVLRYGSQMNVDELEENPNGVRSTSSDAFSKEPDEFSQDATSDLDEDKQGSEYLTPSAGATAPAADRRSHSPPAMDTPEVQESATQADDRHDWQGSPNQLSPTPDRGSKKRQLSDAIKPAKKRSRGSEGATADDLTQTSTRTSRTSTVTDGPAQNSAAIELSEDTDLVEVNGTETPAKDVDVHSQRGKAPSPSSPTATVYADSTDFFLSNKEFRRKLQSVSLAIQSAVQGAMLGLSPATLVEKPSPALKKAYRAIAGAGTSGDSYGAGLLAPNAASNVAFAVIGALAWKDIFNGSILESLCFDNFYSNQLESLGSKVHSLEKQLQPFQTNVDTLLRRAYLDWISDSEAGRAEVAPAVELLKHRMAGVLFEHLEGDDEDSVKGRDARQMALTKALADAVEEMVLLRCQVSCAREEYRFLWPRARAPLDARTMDSPDGEGEEVAVALFPGLCVEVEGVKKVVAKAVVRSV